MKKKRIHFSLWNTTIRRRKRKIKQDTKDARWKSIVCPLCLSWISFAIARWTLQSLYFYATPSTANNPPSCITAHRVRAEKGKSPSVFHRRYSPDSIYNGSYFLSPDEAKVLRFASGLSIKRTRFDFGLSCRVSLIENFPIGNYSLRSRKK